MNVIQVFNKYLVKGGEEIAVCRIRDVLNSYSQFKLHPCLFESKEWLDLKTTPIWKQPFLTFYNPKAIQKVLKEHLKYKADVWMFHNVLPVGSIGLYGYASKHKIPVIQYVHNYRPFSISGTYMLNGRPIADKFQKCFVRECFYGTWQNSRLRTTFMGAVLQWLLSSGYLDSVVAWVCVSKFVRDRFIEAGLPPQKVHALPHFYMPQCNVDSIQDGSHYLFLGRITPEKGIEVLLDTWKILSEELGKKCPELYICGPCDNNYFNILQGKMTSKVKWMGEISGGIKNKIIAACKALLVPSLWWDPLPSVIREAYDYFRPVLGANIGGITEAIVHGKTGFLHEPGNSRELASQIIALEHDNQLRIQLGRAGRIWLEENCGVEEWIENFSSILRNAVKK